MTYDYEATEQDIEHSRRLYRLREVLGGRETDGISNGIGYQPRTAEQIAADEARLAELETIAAPKLAALELKRRTERVKSLELPITAEDEAALCNDTLERTRAVKAVRAWWDTATPLLVLSGPPGRGKTLAGAHALVHVGGRYVRAERLARLYMAPFGEEVHERERLVSTRGVFVIDDIGTERNAEVMCTALVEVLDARRRGQRNVWITNLDRKGFEQRYPDARLHSRMAQSAKWLVDVGDDLRKGAK